MLTAEDMRQLEPVIYCRKTFDWIMQQPGICVERPNDSLALLEVSSDSATVHCYVGRSVGSYAQSLCARFRVCRYNSLRPALARLLARSVRIQRIGPDSWEFWQ